MADDYSNAELAVLGATASFVGAQMMNPVGDNSEELIGLAEKDSVIKNGKVTGATDPIQDTKTPSDNIRTTELKQIEGGRSNGTISTEKANAPHSTIGMDSQIIKEARIKTAKEEILSSFLKERGYTEGKTPESIKKDIEKEINKIGTDKFRNAFNFQSAEEIEKLGFSLTEDQKTAFNSYVRHKNQKGGAKNLPAIVEQKAPDPPQKPPQEKKSWGKRAGFIGVGMTTLAGLGLAVNSLMINDKGRMNNAQMYGQQPYSQY